MDINMPRMADFEGCQELKKCHPNNDFSIVFLTGQNNMESIIHGFEPGDRDYFTEPYDPVSLLARVGTHVALELAQ